MLKRVFFVLAFLLPNVLILAQEIDWKVEIMGFADNREYHSKVQIPQSILGTHFIPQAGLVFDTVHSMYVGVNLLKEFGSNTFVDQYFPYMYYKYSGQSFTFRFGSFPRFDFFAKNPAIMYYDSLNYYRPYINGLFWTYRNGNFTQSVYLDWTSRQSPSRRETFIMGGQGIYKNGLFFVRNYIYMYHFAGPMVPIPGDHVRDNGFAFLGGGLDVSHRFFFDSLSLSVAGVKSFERLRDVENWRAPQGLLVEAIAEYKGFGVSNILYAGQGHHLDWGDPYYRLKHYNRVDLYYSLLQYMGVTARFGISLHIAEGNVSHQQQFLLRAIIGKNRKSLNLKNFDF